LYCIGFCSAALQGGICLAPVGPPVIPSVSGVPNARRFCVRWGGGTGVLSMRLSSASARALKKVAHAGVVVALGTQSITRIRSRYLAPAGHVFEREATYTMRSRGKKKVEAGHPPQRRSARIRTALATTSCRASRSDTYSSFLQVGTLRGATIRGLFGCRE
jgi:hypothetical protein